MNRPLDFPEDDGTCSREGAFLRNGQPEDKKLEWRDAHDVHIKAPADKKYGYVQIHRGKSPNAVRTVSLTERVANTPVERKKAAKRSIFFPARDGGRVPGTWIDRQHPDKAEAAG